MIDKKEITISAEDVLFHEFFEGNNAVKFLIEPENGMILRANNAACVFYGYESEELCAMSIFDINVMPHEESIRHFELVKAGIQQDFEVYHRCFDDTTRNVSINYGLVHIHDDELLLAIITDVTDKRKAETIRYTSQTQFLSLLDSLDVMIYVADLNTSEILFANQYMQDLFNREVIGEKCWDVIHGHELESCRSCMSERLLDENGMLKGVHRWDYMSTRNGRWYQSIDRAMLWIDGRLVRISIGFDITERKQLEQEIITISDKERSRIGHDLHDGIGQYFTGIGFLARIIKDKLKSEGLTETSIAEEILSLIEEAKTHTRVLAKGLSPVNMDKAGLFMAIQELCMDIEKIFGSQCTVVYDKKIEIENNDTAIHIYYIIREAVNNAIRHGNAKHLDIIVKEWDEGIQFEVKDDGEGFDPDTVLKGLGLNFMKYRAALIGGNLTIKKNKKGGTTVSCLLPDVGH